MALAWTLTPERTLGEISGDLALHGIDETSVAVDSFGRMAVLDKGNDRLLFIGADGDLRWTYDVVGRGPGELNNPMAVWITNAGIHILEGTRGAVLTLSPFGVFVGESSTGMLSRGYRGGAVRGVLDSTLFSVVEEPASASQPSAQVLLRAESGDTVEVVRVTVGRSGMMSFHKCRIRYQVDPLFAPSVRWSASNQAAAWVMGFGYDVQVKRRGSVGVRIEGDWPVQSISRDDAVEYAERWRHVTLNGRRCSGDPEDIVQSRGFSPSWQIIRRLAVGPTGEVWVEAQATRQGSARIFVHSENGRLLGQLPADTPFPLLFLSRDEFVTIVTDELDVQYVTVFDVDRG